MFAKYKTAIVGGIALLLIIVTVTLTWFIQSWRYSEKIAVLQAEHEKILAEINRVANQKLLEQQQKTSRLQTELATIEKNQYQELINEKVKNDQLINDLATARKRLSITTTYCTTDSSRLSENSNASSMDNAATRANINPRDAAAIIRITRRGDEAIRQLTACQQYFQEISK